MNDEHSDKRKTIDLDKDRVMLSKTRRSPEETQAALDREMEELYRMIREAEAEYKNTSPAKACKPF